MPSRMDPPRGASVMLPRPAWSPFGRTATPHREAGSVSPATRRGGRRRKGPHMASSRANHPHSRRIRPYLPRELPAALAPLTELALDLRWTWCHACDALWSELDREAWERSQNPWLLLQEVHSARLEALAADPRFVSEVRRLADERERYGATPGWFSRTHAASPLRSVAYFSLEFGFGAGSRSTRAASASSPADYLKAATDWRCRSSASGSSTRKATSASPSTPPASQRETYPYNDPTSAPDPAGRRRARRLAARPLELPGRTAVAARLARDRRARSALYLLDANDPLNAPIDRGITAKLYGGHAEERLLQELVLGIGGWRALDAAGVSAEVCAPQRGARGVRRRSSGPRASRRSARSSFRRGAVGDARRQRLHDAHAGRRGLRRASRPRSSRSTSERSSSRRSASRSRRCSRWAAATRSDRARAVQHGLPRHAGCGARERRERACTGR